MTTDSQEQVNRSQMLATDLDGTLIPLNGDAQQAADLRFLEKELRREGAMLAFVTGRHFASVRRAIAEYSLPTPDIAICNVGTAIYRWSGNLEPEHVTAYSDCLRGLVADMPIAVLRKLLSAIDGLAVQEEEKQSDFKLSFYAPTEGLETTVSRIQEIVDRESAPYSIVHSFDPFKDHGLIDLLPEGVSKAYALKWWADSAGLRADDIVFAGDSGNDYSALTAGYRAIVVGNASRSLCAQVSKAHYHAGWTDRLHLAEAEASSGVLEGAKRFRLIDSQ